LKLEIAIPNYCFGFSKLIHVLELLINMKTRNKRREKSFGVVI
jgi:hypothetical protein